MMAAVLDHLWQSTLLAVGVALLMVVFRRAGAGVRYGLWFAASAKFLVPFAALVVLGRLLAPAVRSPADAASGAVFIARAAQPFSQVYAATPAAHAAPHFDPALVVVAVWALGCGAVVLGWVIRGSRVRSIVRSATPLPWPGPMPVLASSSLLEPGLVGLWRPVLLVPKTLPDHLAKPEIDAILAHEACHLRRRDNLTAAIHMLVETLFWFHPLVWWIGARLIEERERACDEAVVRSGHDRAAYARSLVECCRLYLQSPLPCMAGASGSDLKTRVEMIMTAPLASPLSPLKKIVLFAAVAFAVASPLAAGALTSPVGHPVAARLTAVVSGSAPARVDEARRAGPTSAAIAAPEERGSAKAITIAWSGVASAPDRSVADIEAPALPSALDIAAPGAEQALPGPGAEDAVGRSLNGLVAYQADDEDVSRAVEQAARRQAPPTMRIVSRQAVGETAADAGKPLPPAKGTEAPLRSLAAVANAQTTEGHCYILFGELRCDRIQIGPPSTTLR